MAASTPSTGLDATFKFTPTGATSPSTPAQPDEPGIITLTDGRKMQVTIEIKVQGVWKKVDTSKYGAAEKLILQELADKCEGIYEATTKDSGKPKSLTVHLARNNNTESFWKSRVLGKFFTSLKEDIINLDLKKLEFKTTASDATQVFDLENEELDTNDALTVRAHLKDLDPLAKRLYKHARQLTAKPKKINPPTDPVSATIDSCIQDAGAKGNRCAALSLAKIELEKHTIEEITAKYKLDSGLPAAFNAAPPEGRLEMLAEALVQKAAEIIGDPDVDNPFLDDKIDDKHKPGLAAVKVALEEMKESTEGTPEEIVKRYADKIRVKGEMLDLPFFLALGQPFIIIHKPDPKGPNKIWALGDRLRIEDTIENCDFEDVNILFYNSKDHYRSVILETEEQKDAMRILCRRAIDEQIDELINRLGRKDITDDAYVRLQNEAADLCQLYPKARDELIEKLQKKYPDKLKAEDVKKIKISAPEIIIRDLYHAIHH